MTRSIVSRLSIAVLALAAVSACGNQSGADYQGEPLFEIKATVEVPKPFEGEDLVPVILFTSYTPAEEVVWEILDVGVRGSFPSSFTLSIFDRPPEAPLHSNDEDGQPYAVGYLAAMAASHPSRMKMINPPESRFLTRYCTLDESRCYEKTWSCPNDVATEECTIGSRSGDPTLAFAGYSVNVTLFYNPDPIPAESWLSFVWGNGEAIAAGYHLYRRVPPESQGQEWARCFVDSLERGYADYNAAHGTEHSLGDGADVEFPRELDVLQRIRQKEAGCLIPKGVLEIRDPATTPVSITLGAERLQTNLEPD